MLKWMRELIARSHRIESASDNFVRVFITPEQVAAAHDEALRWAAETLAAEGFHDFEERPVHAIRELRRSRSGLSLLGAKTLVDELIAQRS